MSEAESRAGDNEAAADGTQVSSGPSAARTIDQNPSISKDDDRSASGTRSASGPDRQDAFAQSGGRTQVQQQVQGYPPQGPGGQSGAAGGAQQSSPQPTVAGSGFGPPPPVAPPTAAPPAGAAAATGRPAPRTRRARLRVSKADPWSVMKVSFLLSLALGVVTIVAVSVLWMVLDAIGVFSTVGKTMLEVTAGSEGGGFDLENFLSLPRVLMFTSIIAVIDVILATALATLASFIYNISSSFVGGVELTLAEDD